MMLFTSIVLISFYQIIIVHGQFNLMNDDDFPFFPFRSSNWISEEFLNRLNDFYPGNTVKFADLSDIITNSRMDDDVCELQFTPHIINLFDSRILIGQLSSMNQIVTVQISFHDDNGDIIRDMFGNPIEYRSSRQELGHVLDILHQGFAFSYAKCLLRLQPNSNFDPHSLFFHFSQSLPSTTLRNNLTGIINGRTSFPFDSIGQIYNVSVHCPFDLTCMWLLDNEVISNTANSSVTLTFEQRHIGNRTLSYVVYIGNNPRTLALLPLSILPSTRQECDNLPRFPRNRWIRARNMSTPRVNFTATYLQQSGNVMIVGGTADGSTPLSLADIYDPFTGCHNISNMFSPRMEHRATYYNNSDIVFLIGGVGQDGDLIQHSEFIWINGTQRHQRMIHPRRSHEIAILNNSDIIIVAGRGIGAAPEQLESYNRTSSTFQPGPFHPLLINLEGHSVTSLGNSGIVLIFGGYNGSTYSGAGLLADEMTITLIDSENTGTITARAHHQATYISQIDAVLITGGDNGTQTFSSCYLYYPDTQTFNATSSMQTGRSFHTAVSLLNGSVLIIGGVKVMDNNQPAILTTSVERYDYTTHTFTTVTSLNDARYWHAALLLPGDEVFVFGGIGSNGRILSSIEYIMLTQ